MWVVVFTKAWEKVEGHNMADYPTGYWGATVIAVFKRNGLFVSMTDMAIYDASWRFEDPPESELDFERTGREIVLRRH